MSPLGRICLTALAAIFVSGAVSCSHGSNYTSPSELPSLSDIATQVPEWMQTPDPAIYELGEDGYFEDEYITAYFPSYFTLKSIEYGNVKYSAKP